MFEKLSLICYTNNNKWIYTFIEVIILKEKNNESAENYLETILVLSKRLPVVRSVDVANQLDLKK